jgi:hypothetical protein
MTNLVERLKARAPFHNVLEQALHIEAADEIERLRTELDYIQRMKVVPDDAMNRFTLVTAISTARTALWANGRSKK